MKHNKVYEMLKRKGYSENFCRLIGNECSTEFMIRRMTGYLCNSKNVRMGDIVDEVLAIESEREHIINKKIYEYSNKIMNSL